MACTLFGRFSVAAVLIISGFSISECNNACSDGWEKFKDKCYYVVEDQMHYYDAVHVCQYLGGKLAEPKTCGQNEFIQNLAITFTERLRFSQSGTTSFPDLTTYLWNKRAVEPRRNARWIDEGDNDFWIGGRLVNQQWLWNSDATPIEHGYWVKFEPNQSGECVQLWTEGDFGWDDDVCTTRQYAICEKDAE